MEIIDVLQPAYSKCPFFTVDTSAGSVPVTPDGGSLCVWGNSPGQMGKFQERDNIRLISIGYYIPESFTTADPDAPIYDNTSGTPAHVEGVRYTALVTAHTWTAGVSYVSVSGSWVDMDTIIPSTSIQLSVSASNNGPLAVYLPGLGSSNNGLFAIPFPNYELTLDLYCDIANIPYAAPVPPPISGTGFLPTGAFYVLGSLYCSKISMIGVPAALNGKIIRIIPFVKILHTLPLLTSV